MGSGVEVGAAPPARASDMPAGWANAAVGCGAAACCWAGAWVASAAGCCYCCSPEDGALGAACSWGAPQARATTKATARTPNKAVRKETALFNSMYLRANLPTGHSRKMWPSHETSRAAARRNLLKRDGVVNRAHRTHCCLAGITDERSVCFMRILDITDQEHC